MSRIELEYHNTRCCTHYGNYCYRFYTDYHLFLSGRVLPRGFHPCPLSTRVPKLLLFCRRCFLFVFAPTICKETSALSCHRFTAYFHRDPREFFFFFLCSVLSFFLVTRNGMFQLVLREL